MRFVRQPCVVRFLYAAHQRERGRMMKDPAAFPLRKSEITADGTDKVTFTAKYGEEDVTANASIRTLVRHTGLLRNP